MATHNSSPDQGSFFEIELVGNGSTDPENYGTQAVIKAVNPEGVFEDLPVAESIPEFPEEPKPAKSQHTAQLGRHSALERDGHYRNIRIGDYLPGIGAVTPVNLIAAREQAAKLEKQRTNGR